MPWPERALRDFFREIWPFFTGAKFLRNLGVVWVQKYFAEISFLFAKISQKFREISRNFYNLAGVHKKKFLTSNVNDFFVEYFLKISLNFVNIS